LFARDVEKSYNVDVTITKYSFFLDNGGSVPRDCVKCEHNQLDYIELENTICRMLWIFRETGLENEMEYLIRMKLITITMTINNNLFL
jgi:hypothetical protein